MSDKKSEQKGISRRGFLKGAAVAAATGAAGGLIMGSQKTAGAADSLTMDTRAAAKSSRMSVDICVIGGAGAGLVAAASAVEAGVKNVIVLEKMKQTGGCTLVGVAGMFSVESPVQKRLGINISMDEMYQHHMDMCTWYCNGKLVRNWYTTTGSVVDWLEKKGVAVGNWLSIGYGPFGSCFSFTTYSGYAAGKNAAKFVLGEA